MKFGFFWPRIFGAGFSLLVVSFLFFGTGCVSNEKPKQKDDIAALKAQVWSLQKKLAEISLKVSQNSNDILQIRETGEKSLTPGK